VYREESSLIRRTARGPSGLLLAPSDRPPTSESRGGSRATLPQRGQNEWRRLTRSSSPRWRAGKMPRGSKSPAASRLVAASRALDLAVGRLDAWRGHLRSPARATAGGRSSIHLLAQPLAVVETWRSPPIATQSSPFRWPRVTRMRCSAVLSIESAPCRNGLAFHVDSPTPKWRCYDRRPFLSRIPHTGRRSDDIVPLRPPALAWNARRVGIMPGSARIFEGSRSKTLATVILFTQLTCRKRRTAPSL